ncbi:DHH family phosphoesterase [Candidatus Woesearchaeota archaeon]|nr:DHH family phosphoesterase [Candidatus Woesearchaeota archaeon]
MALTQKQYQHIKDELDHCQNPLYFFDDDPDGLSSFLLLYRYKKEGHGIVVKTHPKLDARLSPSLEDYKPDKVFVLDVALLGQDFVDACPEPIVWIDHHGPHKVNGVLYFNPRIRKKDSNTPTTYMCYNVVKQDLWIAALGSIADYYIPEFLGDFRKQYPDLIEDKNTIGDIYFTTKLGTLIKIFSFCLKGKTADVMKNIKILTRIKTPYEILNQETAAGKFIYKRYEKLNKIYNDMLKSAVKAATRDKLLVFTYEDDKMSFTGDIANELLYQFPDKVILVGRKKDDDVRMSIRSKNTILPPLLDKALAGLEGYGGGHEYACGANVKQRQFREFVENLKKNLA